MAKLLRLDKYLSDMNIGSRSEIKIWIRKEEFVSILSLVKPEEKVEINKDEVSFDGR